MVLREFMLHEIPITEVMIYWPGGDVFFRGSKILLCFENVPASLNLCQIFVCAKNDYRLPWDHLCLMISQIFYLLFLVAYLSSPNIEGLRKLFGKINRLPIAQTV